ncbi:hypothetical protein SAMN04515671_2001 [Nakamurella panacisegetis]|uniref:Uncharacterized protein n=1 Tax=Nakamurella panacisegetis TaxID=1090615 RepID=A0A1H0MFR5_9ACTN|nr:hypothetical protein [Nakamurella panacisegetis]SDO79217.1 hypothetical protein SAMN04515671_2001 [Nakamurella panacisegetis]
MTSLAKRLARWLDALADRPADPGALTGDQRGRRTAHRAVVPEPDPGKVAEPSGRASGPDPEPQGREALDRILAEQRNRMRGRRRRPAGE